MNNQDALVLGIGALAVILYVLLLLAIHFFYAWCMASGLKKIGKEPGILIWIPALQFIPLLKGVDMSPWWALLLIGLIVPILNMVVVLALMVVSIIMWVKLFQARDKNPLLLILLLIPLVNLCIIPYWGLSK